MATRRRAILLGAQPLVEAFDVLLRAASWCTPEELAERLGRSSAAKTAHRPARGPPAVDYLRT